MDDIELWHNPRCSKSRAAHDLLGDRATTRRYLEDPPTRAELEAVLVKLGTDDPRLIVRTGEPAYAGLEAADRDELLDAMVAHPELVERPIAIRGDRAVLGRPPERVLELLRP
ncbi:MAG TPA: ArsC/Spx/MgsR family protein [Mycobacteriales bacterium]|nr:ArsC/Spx/MgsR family protein [Mycobacteriales bacterium]